MYGNKNLLVGAVILSMTHDDDAITFVTDKGTCTAHTYGDCCSSTWIESVELPARGFPATVQEVLNVDLPSPASDRDREEMQYYGLRIVTDNGDIDIDYRNSSNGYYGGSLDFPASFS